jgi:hypothetical protein
MKAVYEFKTENFFPLGDPWCPPLLGPPFFLTILFGYTTLLTGMMTGIALRMQWPLTSQSHGRKTCFWKS